MPLELLHFFICNIYCILNVFLSIMRISEMNFMMTVGAQGLQIIGFIVFSIVIFMMYNKKIYIALVAQVAFYQSVFFNRFSKSFCNIIKFTFNASRFCCTIPGAKFFYPALKFYPARYYNAAFLTWLPLNARQRAVFLILPKTMRPKWLFARFANYFFFSSVFVRTTSRATQLLHTFSQVFEGKRFFTYNTILHNGAFKGRIV